MDVPDGWSPGRRRDPTPDRIRLIGRLTRPIAKKFEVASSWIAPCDDAVMSHSVRRWDRALDAPLTISTVLFLIAYAWPILDVGLSEGWQRFCSVVVWGTWVLLCVDFVVRLVMSSDRGAFLRSNPIDLATVVLPLLRPLRLLRLVTLLSALNRYAGNSLRGKVGIYLVGSVVLLVFVGALAVLDAERGGEGSIQSFGDAIWWALATITTVGYGDIYPVTTVGRSVAVLLMFGGIATLGVVTASFASWLVQRVSEIEESSQTATRADVERLAAEVKALREVIADRRA